MRSTLSFSSVTLTVIFTPFSGGSVFPERNIPILASNWATSPGQVSAEHKSRIFCVDLREKGQWRENSETASGPTSQMQSSAKSFAPKEVASGVDVIEWQIQHAFSQVGRAGKQCRTRSKRIETEWALYFSSRVKFTDLQQWWHRCVQDRRVALQIWVWCAAFLRSYRRPDVTCFWQVKQWISKRKCFDFTQTFLGLFDFLKFSRGGLKVLQFYFLGVFLLIEQNALQNNRIFGEELPCRKILARKNFVKIERLFIVRAFHAQKKKNFFLLGPVVKSVHKFLSRSFFLVFVRFCFQRSQINWLFPSSERSVKGITFSFRKQMVQICFQSVSKIYRFWKFSPKRSKTARMDEQKY